MAAYHQVYDSRHLQVDCQEPGSAPEPYTRQSSMGYLYLVYLVNPHVQLIDSILVSGNVLMSATATDVLL